MRLTTSYEETFPEFVLARYDFIETRNASQILQATNPEQFSDIVDVLASFTVDVAGDILTAGGSQSDAAARLNHAFRDLGWREASYSTNISSKMILRAPGSPAIELDHEQEATSYNIDNVKGRVALDVEWHAKDGNLDRDISAYRSFYDAEMIDCGVIITTSQASMRAWVLRLNPESKKFGTTTTTNIEKATPRLTRGDGGGCPILVAAIGDRTV